MKAAIVGDQGVEVREVAKPAPKANEILIRVRAASLNRADLAVAAGNRHGAAGGPGTIVGLECAGEVEAVGSAVTEFRPGDRVMSSAAGGFAEYAVADAGRAHRIPANNMTFEQAASLPIAYGTAQRMLISRGRLQPGELVLILGASGGVGTGCVQIAKNRKAGVIACAVVT